MPSQPHGRQAQRGQGQWALGHHEPLNPAERFKKDDPGLNVRDRIINRYAHLGFDSIDPSDLRGRFRWWGYTPSASQASRAAVPGRSRTPRSRTPTS